MDPSLVDDWNWYLSAGHPLGVHKCNRMCYNNGLKVSISPGPLDLRLKLHPSYCMTKAGNEYSWWGSIIRDVLTKNCMRIVWTEPSLGLNFISIIILWRMCNFFKQYLLSHCRFYFCLLLRDLATECPPVNPCLNGGTCVEGAGTIFCQCRAEFLGPLCQRKNKIYCGMGNYHWRQFLLFSGNDL